MTARRLFATGSGSGGKAGRWPWWLRVLVGLVIFLVLYAALGFLLVPWIARSQVEKILGQQLDRPASVEKVRFNPFTLHLVVSNLKVGARDGDGNNGQPLFTLGALDADAAWSSLTQLAPVLSSIKVVSPHVSLARLPDGRYSISDLLDKWSQQPKTESTGVPKFSITNIELDDGQVAFDDQLKKLKHELAALGIKVPFISSLPVNEEVKVEPLIEATLNGSSFKAAGTTEPFSPSRESNINLDLGAIDLVDLVAYAPQPLPLKVESGKLTLKAKVQFEQPPNAKPTLSIDGQVGVAQLDLRETSGEPLLKLGDVTASALKLRPLDNDYRVGSLVITGLDAVVHRREGQKVFFESVMNGLAKNASSADAGKSPDVPSPSPSATPSPAPPASATPLHWQIDDIKLDGAKLDFADALFSPKPLALRLEPMNIAVQGVSSDQGAPLAYKADIKTASSESLVSQGKVVIAPLDVQGDFKLDQVALKNWWWLAEPTIAATVVDGQVGAEGKFHVQMPESGLQAKLDGLGLKLSKVALRESASSRAGGAGPSASASGSSAPASGSSSAASVTEGAKAGAKAAAKASTKAVAKAPAAAKSSNLVPAAAPVAAAAGATGKAAVVKADDGEFLNIPDFSVSGSSLDLAARSVVIGAVTSAGGRVKIRKDTHGTYNVQHLMVPSSPSTSPSTAPSSAPPAKSAAPATAPWQVRLGHLQLDNYAIDMKDVAAGKPGDVLLDNLKLGINDLMVSGEQPKGSPGKLDLQARFNQKGSLSINGPLSLAPMATKLAIDARSLPVLPAQPYITQYVNAVIANGRASAKGDLTFEMPSGKPTRIVWRGDAGIDEFSALTRQSSRDLLRWKSLQVKGIDLNVEPLAVKVDDITLGEFYARLILSAEARLNLQDLLVKADASGAGAGKGGARAAAAGNRPNLDLSKPTPLPGANAASPGPTPSVSAPAIGAAPTTGSASATAAAPATGAGPATGTAPDAAASGAAGANAPAGASAQAPTQAPASDLPDSPEDKARMLKQAEAATSFGGDASKSAAPAAPPPPSGPPPNVHINRITLTNANIDFSDFFIRPNYSANLTGLNGTITKISPDTTGELQLKGRIDNAGSVDVTGKLNPFSTAMTMDIRADARDIDLPRLSPYSVKYIGYGIEKGKLSATVNYKIVDRKLTAENKVVLDQFTLGDKVPSPTALNLPVQFALSLLKDRNGVIDVELPVSGSIDDPQFSVGGVVLRLIVNLIVKAVTSPFALLGGLGGGGSAEMAQLPFAPGQAKLEPESVSRLEKLAKALQDRPALKVDVAGRADTARDSDALNRLRLQRRVKALKVKEDVDDGGDSTKIDQVTLTPEEYERLLRQYYKAQPFEKPRNAIGLVKDLPVPEMEKLLLDNSKVNENQLRNLANQRAQSVKDWLSQTGHVATERLYITSSKLDKPAGEGGGDAAKAAADAGAELALK